MNKNTEKLTEGQKEPQEKFEIQEHGHFSKKAWRNLNIQNAEEEWSEVIDFFDSQYDSRLPFGVVKPIPKNNRTHPVHVGEIKTYLTQTKKQKQIGEVKKTKIIVVWVGEYFDDRIAVGLTIPDAQKAGVLNLDNEIITEKTVASHLSPYHWDNMKEVEKHLKEKEQK